MKEMHANELIAYTSEIFFFKSKQQGWKITTILKAKTI